MIRPLGVSSRNCEISWGIKRQRVCWTRLPCSQRVMQRVMVPWRGSFRGHSNNMVELRYPIGSLVYDYLRGILGLGISLVIIQSIGLDTPIFWVILGLAALFLVWLANTALRHLSRIRFDEEGLISAPWPKKSIAWSGLEEMALRYYSTKRKRKDGWMTLTLKAGKEKIDIESTLPHFADIVARAAYAAKQANLPLDQVTVDNMDAIGVKVDA